MSKQITVSSTINASINKVWNYYITPEHIKDWNFADPSWHCPTASNDMSRCVKHGTNLKNVFHPSHKYADILKV